MDNFQHIVPPVDAEDTEGADRVFNDFFVLYQPTFVNIEHHLQQIMEQMPPAYADAYRPWHKALQDLFRGVYLVAKKIPLPDQESFMDALRMFSFGSAIQFLNDLCISCRLTLPRDWAQRFQEHINMLLFSIAILNRQQQPVMSR